MNFWEFLIRLIEALAWPVAASVILIYFRADLQKLLPLMQKLKAGPLEAEFRQEAQDIAQEAQEIKSEAEEIELGAIGQLADSKRLTELANLSPRSAIVDSWVRLETAIKHAIVQNAGSPIPDMSSPLRLVKAVEQLELINEKELRILDDLRGIRNQALHFSETGLSSDAAIDYGQAAQRLESRFKQLAKHEPQSF